MTFSLSEKLSNQLIYTSMFGTPYGTRTHKFRREGAVALASSPNGAYIGIRGWN